MGCFPFANFHFQMGVTVMGFAEDFGLNEFHGCQSVMLAGANLPKLLNFMGAKYIPLKIFGCHSTRGTQNNAPSEMMYQSF